MPFHVYMLHCRDRTFYVGHTDDLDVRLAQHQDGSLGGYTAGKRPVTLVWCEEFPSRYEALAAERQVKGWSRAKKMALIRGDWGEISRLAKGKEGRPLRRRSGQASTSSGRTVGGCRWDDPHSVRPEPVEGRHFHLLRHPATPSDGVRNLKASVAWASGSLHLDWTLIGEMDRVVVPPPALPARRDGLWRTTCFEAFVARPDGSYAELNLSPSGEWAAYSFAGYRDGMVPLAINAPGMTCSVSTDTLELSADAAPPFNSPFRLGLSAVIEETSGRISYWALAHPAAKPDFHHPDSFVHEIR